MNKKIKYVIIYIISIILTLFLGAISTIIVLDHFNIDKRDKK